MKMDIVGRVKNIALSPSKPLLPLFEAITNSVEAIEEAKIEDGKITIEIMREEDLLLPDPDRADITGFIIKDNGIGFNDQNYDAFITSDTTYKASSGGKGIGRFMWLVAFEKVKIDSVFKEQEISKRRKFIFTALDDGVKDISCRDDKDASRETSVSLLGFREKYRKACPKKLETIATLIVEQFLDVFIRPNCPTILLRENSSGEEVSLDQFYEKLVPGTSRKEIMLKGKKFYLLFVKLYSSHINEHKVNFCANDRVVVSENLAGIPNLLNRFKDDKGNDFVCAVYVHSQVLDDAVNSERTNFNISEDLGTLFEADISLKDIKDAIKNACREYLAPFTEPVAREKQERIEKYIQQEGIMYRPILKHLQDKIDEIDPSASDDELDRALYDGYHILQVNLRQEAQELHQAISGAKDMNWEQLQNKFEEYFEKVTEANRSDLARYVCHRKAIIEFLKNQLELQSDGKYAPEERVHSIIFPRGKTSDDILFNDHNLWLIDERLAFHTFLSSDQPIKQAKVLKSDSKKEPDILVFDKAVAFSDSIAPFTSITILEFKKPLRKDYDDKENPFLQVTKYIDEIKAGKIVMSNGRPFEISQNLPFYCFVICDLTNKLKDWARFFGLEETPDGLGYFGYKKSYSAYFEVISYNKLVADAEKRNRAFFEKIGL